MRTPRARAALALSVVFAVGACGGGGQSAPPPPTANPASESTPTANPAPESTPTATASQSTPSVAASTAPTFSDIELSGEGHAVEEFTIPEDTLAIATMIHNGESNFIVNTVDVQGEQVDGLVNEIGDYAGTVLIKPDDDREPVAFQIDADGAWQITVKPVTAARPWD